MELNKNTLITFIQLITKIIVALFITKLVLKVTGKIGLIDYGAYTNFFSIISILSILGIQTAIVKLSATNEYNKQDLKSSITLLLSIGVSISIIIIVILAFNDIFDLVALILIFFCGVLSGISLLGLSVLNGEGKIFLYNKVIIQGSLINISLVCLLIDYYYVYSCLVGLLICQLYICFKTKAFNNLNKFNLKINKNVSKITLKLLNYGFASILSGILIALIQILIREKLLANSLNDAATWEALFRICLLINLFCITPMSIYMLPKVAKEINHKFLKSNFYYLSLLVIMINVSLFFLSKYILQILYNQDISNSSSLLSVLVIGESLKVFGMYYSIVFWARNKMKYFMINEIIFFIVLMFLLLFISQDINDVIYAYILSCLVYLIAQILSFKKIKVN